MRPRLAPVLLTVATLAAVLPVTALGAEPPSENDPRQRARELGERAIEALNQAEYAEAVELLRQAEALFHAPTHLLFMARAYRQLDRLSEAYDAYQALANEPIPDYAPEPFHAAQQQARQELAELRQRLPTLQIRLRGAPASGVQTTIDGKPVGPTELARPVPLLPGDHVVEARAAGRRPVRQKVVLHVGDAPRALELALVPDEPPRAPAAPAPAPGPEPDEPAATSAVVVSGIVVLGVGAAALGVGAVTGALTLSRASDIHDSCVDEHCPPDREDEADATHTLGNVSTALLVVGGVAAATGLVLLLAAPDEPSTQGGRGGALGLRIAPGGAGLWAKF